MSNELVADGSRWRWSSVLTWREMEREKERGLRTYACAALNGLDYCGVWSMEYGVGVLSWDSILEGGEKNGSITTNLTTSILDHTLPHSLNSHTTSPHFPQYTPPNPQSYTL